MKCAWRFCWLPRSLTNWWVRLIMVFLAMALTPCAGLNLSVYSAGLEFTNQKGKKMKLSELTGQRTLFALFYTSCKTICPMTTAKLKEIEADRKKQGQAIQIVLITIDQADQPKQLSQFARDHGIENWHLLVSKKEQAKIITQLLGLGYQGKRSDPELHQMHSQNFIEVDGDGKIVGKISL